jgi:hypothetical protein
MDIIDQRLDNVERVLIVQEANLSEHMKRTALLENQVSPLNKFMYAAYGILGFLTFAAAIYAAWSKS